MRDDYKFRSDTPLQDGSGITGHPIHPGVTLGVSMEVSVTQSGSPSQNCKQTITMTGDPDSGTWKLKLDTKKTAAIQYNDSAASVQSALEALASIGAGNVTCTGGPINTGPVEVEFVGDLAAQSVTEMKALFGMIDGGAGILKGDYGYVAKKTGGKLAGEETRQYETVKVYNRFRDCGPQLECLYVNTGNSEELIQVECE